MDEYLKEFENVIDPLNYPFDIDKVMKELNSEIGDKIEFQFYYLPRLLSNHPYDLTKNEEIQRLKKYLMKRNILEIENHRFKRQAAKFTEKEIQEYILKNFNSLHPYFNELDVIGEEQKLGKGRIDLLTKDPKDNTFIGIELKKTATKSNVQQFYRYLHDLKEEFGEKSKLIVLSNRFTEPLLELDMNLIQPWRYEIQTEYRKYKTKENKFLIKNIKAHPFFEDTRLMKLINWRA